MNDHMQSIDAAHGSGAYTLRTLVAGFGALVVSATVVSASFTEDFQDDTVGASAGPNWTISGANGTTRTANVAVEGDNRFLALRDFDAGGNLSLTRSDPPINGLKETLGYLQFDIRFNQGVNFGFGLRLFATKSGFCGSCLEPINLGWFHNANNTNGPLIFNSRGNGAGFGTPDPNANAQITNNFPIGSWETIRVEFVSKHGDPRGMYTVGWNGITNTYLYLNQGDFGANQASLALDSLVITPGGSTTSVDLDNIQFIPEPGAMTVLAFSSMALMLARRRR